MELTDLSAAQNHLFWEAFMAWQLHPTASAGYRIQGSNKLPTVIDGLWSHHRGQYILYFAWHAEPVRLTEHLECTRTSEQKKKEKELSKVSAIAGHVAKQPLHHSVHMFPQHASVSASARAILPILLPEHRCFLS